MDWVHCNNCYVIPGTGKRFFLTSCGHIYCADCKISCTTESCKLCGNQCSTIPLSSQMKPDVEMYFTDPLELLKKYLKQVQQVAEFQNNHRARLMVHQTDQMNKLRQIRNDFKKTREEAKKAIKVLRDFGEENMKLKRENEYLKSSRSNPNMYRVNSGGSCAMNSVLSTPIFPEKDSGMISRGNSSGGSHRSYENIRDFLSPNEVPGPSRISIRTPPMNGKIEAVEALLVNLHYIVHLHLVFLNFLNF